MNAYNRILGVAILTCCLTLFGYFIFPNNIWIRTNLESWVYSLFFIIPILLLIISKRFKRINDIRGKKISHVAAFCYLGCIVFPLSIFLIDVVFIGKDLPTFILFIFPAISLILTFLVSFRLFQNHSVTNAINPITKNPYL